MQKRPSTSDILIPMTNVLAFMQILSGFHRCDKKDNLPFSLRIALYRKTGSFPSVIYLIYICSHTQNCKIFKHFFSFRRLLNNRVCSVAVEPWQSRLVNASFTPCCCGRSTGKIVIANSGQFLAFTMQIMQYFQLIESPGRYWISHSRSTSTIIRQPRTWVMCNYICLRNSYTDFFQFHSMCFEQAWT